MTDAELMTFARALGKYLEAEKRFVRNPARIAEVADAEHTARALFPNATITIADDPLQMGALILSVTDLDLVVRDTEQFERLISKATNFEIYSIGDDTVQMNILFNKAFTRLP